MRARPPLSTDRSRGATSTFRRLLPTGLVAQMVVVMAAALLVAQLANFALLLGDRQVRQLTERRDTAEAVVVPTVVRLAFVPSVRQGEEARLLTTPRSGVSMDPDSLVRRLGLPRDGPLEQRLAGALAEAGVPVGAIEAGSRIRRVGLLREGTLEQRLAGAPADNGGPFDPIEPGGRPPPPPFPRGPGGPPPPPRIPPDAIETLAAVRTPYAADWINIRVITPPEEPWLSLRLGAATLLLYVAVLGTIVLLARRIGRPFAALARAARQMGDGRQPDPLPVDGPSDVRAAVVAFNAMSERVAGMIREKDAMLGAIGHDLRTPLTALRIRAENLPSSPDRERMIGTIEHMSRTVEGIMALARLGADREDPSVTDLTALAETLADEFTDIGADVTVAAAGRVIATVRPHQVTRMLRNLVENAVKYGTRARLGVEGGEDAVTLRIEDDGPGLPADAIARLLEPFERLEGSRNRATGGTGLGLSIVRRVVEGHGGTLRFANRPEGGLVVTVGLPRVEGRAEGR